MYIQYVQYILTTLIYFQRESTSQMQVEWHMCKPRLKDKNHNLFLSNSTSHWDLLYPSDLYSMSSVCSISVETIQLLLWHCLFTDSCFNSLVISIDHATLITLGSSGLGRAGRACRRLVFCWNQHDMACWYQRHMVCWYHWWIKTTVGELIINARVSQKCASKWSRKSFKLDLDVFFALPKKHKIINWPALGALEKHILWHWLLIHRQLF